MRRCLQLAALGRSAVYPNPMVGAVIVQDGRIIGEGYHEYYGGPHAEVNAIRSVKDPSQFKTATLYVSLEPCCHFGKTPPCTDLIILSGIPRVVVACKDPNPIVIGKGMDRLRKAGVEVTGLVLEKEAIRLNHRFYNQYIPSGQQVNYVLKWAETRDGIMGRDVYQESSERRISNAISQLFVHRLRTECDAILIGTNTALTDNPFLDNRYWPGRIPDAVVIDKDLKVPVGSNLFRSDRRTILLNARQESGEGHTIYRKLTFNENPGEFWRETDKVLSGLGIHTLLIEGGSHTLQSFLASGMHAEVIRIVGTVRFNEGIKAPVIEMEPQDAGDLGNNRVYFYTV